jgi:hypothetical protein
MHPTEADIVLFLEKRLPPDDRRRIHAHLADCPRCAETLAAVYRMPETLARRDDASPATARLRRRAESFVQRPATTRSEIGRRPKLALAAFASVVILSVVLLAYLQRDAVAPDRFRTPEAETSLATIAPAHRLTVDAESLAFRWAPLPNATAYRLLLYTQDGAGHWTGRSPTTRLALPDTVAVTPGAQYLWRVEAVFSDGATTSSELRAFTVATATEE